MDPGDLKGVRPAFEGPQKRYYVCIIGSRVPLPDQAGALLVHADSISSGMPEAFHLVSDDEVERPGDPVL